ELDAVLDVRQFLAERIDAGQSSRRAFHERGEIRSEQVEAGIGESAEVARLERGARDDKRAAEGPFMAPLCVAGLKKGGRSGSGFGSRGGVFADHGGGQGGPATLYTRRPHPR